MMKPAETAKRSGRRRRSSKVGKDLTNKKTKQRQRGMGVAQLEQLRSMQEKKMTEIISPLNLHSPFLHHQLNGPDPRILNSSSLHLPETNMGGGPGVCDMGLNYPANNFLVQQRGFVCNGNQVISGNDLYQFQMGLYGFINCETNELSSRPNLVSSTSCFSAHSPFCNNDAAEVVAIHKKESSSSVVMEYDFFPEKGGKRNSCSEKKMMMSSWSESSSVAAAVGGEASCVTTISMADHTSSSSSIDLSLKLSC